MSQAPTLSAFAVLRDGLRIVGRFVRGHPWSFALAVGGAALFAGALAASAFVIGWVTDTAILPVLRDGEAAGGRVLAAVAAIAAVALWKAVSIVLRRTAAGWLQFKTQQDVREELIGHELGLELSWFGRQSMGDLLSVADNDARQGTGVLAPLPYATGVSLLLVATPVLLAVVDYWLGITAAVGMAVVVAVEVRAAVSLYPVWEGIQHQLGVVSDVAHESFDGALTVKALGREEFETGRLRRESELLRDRLVRLGVGWETYRTLILALIPAASLAMLAVGAVRVDAGAVSAGDVVSALYLLSLLGFPIQLIAFVLFELAAAIPAWKRVTTVLAADELVVYGSREAHPDAGAAPVDGEHVSFSYDGAPVLTDVVVDVPAGRTVAIVGPTASGKTTLTLLLARLWDPGTGRIRLDGRDLRSFARAELPREVAYVSQGSFLFDDTVRGNVEMGLDLGAARVEEAGRLAGAHDFVTELPDGYETRLGERGATLSGGQRQRIALARALARRPRLLILDDATSAVDPSVETEILRRLRSADLPSTIVVVAYRPSSIRLADEVIFVEDGRVVDQGSHADLLARQPGYARLVQAYEEDAATRSGERR